MKFVEDKLEALDEYFAPKKESEKWLMILVLAGVISYIAFDFFLPYTEGLFKKSESTKATIEKSIVDNKTYLRTITRNNDKNYQVKKLDKEIVFKKREIENFHNNIKFIDKNLEKLSDMLFNQKSWSKFLNSITNKAEVQNVDLSYITNKYADSNGSFGYVLEIGVGCTGDYKNIVKFINELEQNRLVTDIYGLNLKSNLKSNKVLADINISVWGINH